MLDVEETQQQFSSFFCSFQSSLCRSMSTFCNLRRHNSWPLTTALGQTFKYEVKRYSFIADQNLPFFVRRNEECISETSSASDMPAALCGWCGSINCNGVHLFYCKTWRNLSAELDLELPMQLRCRFWLDGFTTTRRCVSM